MPSEETPPFTVERTAGQHGGFTVTHPTFLPSTPHLLNTPLHAQYTSEVVPGFDLPLQQTKAN